MRYFSDFMTRNILFIGLLAMCLGIFISSCSSSGSMDYEIDVLVIGGGTSGVAAGIQAARSGANTIVVEETPWLGGMLTSAGVSATDGNHQLPSGLWGEFRDRLYQHYGGPDALATGWVSNTQFEPNIGNKIWNEMADQESNLKRLHGYSLRSIVKTGKKVTGATFENAAGFSVRISAEITIDATELGDAIALAGANFFVGQDPKSLTAEEEALEKPTPFIQDLTYVAILQDYGSEDMTLEEPDGYNPDEFNCMCAEVCDDPTANVISCDKMLDYGKLPNGKYMINWPNQGNDYYVNAVNMSSSERQTAFENAKNRTLSWIYFLQTKGGYRHLGLAEEFPTEDRLALIPYHREGRRVDGLTLLTLNDLRDPYQDVNRPLYQYAVAVGDYPVDLHHKKNPEVKPEKFPAIPSFSIPFTSMVPKVIDGLISAEKNISVSHIANGSTRLQPCVILIGQAAGVAAAIAASQKVAPRSVDIRTIQQHLLDANCWLMPFLDTTPDSKYFQPLQKMGVSGVLKGHGIPYKWANQTWIYPDSMVTVAEVAQAIDFCLGLKEANFNDAKIREITRKEAVLRIWQAAQGSNENSFDQSLKFSYHKDWLPWQQSPETDMEKTLTRKELAFILDRAFDPFNTLPPMQVSPINSE
ncbi:MAG: FAD-dependent oxidoreductase [Cyclobacteriaceae bacterium]|nr:FAD-dependent oxidoreductase [Cyclobacteriaceae bacterium HetDA_MAG_MS6]